MEFCTWRTMLNVFAVCILAYSLTTITKMPTYGSCEYKEEGSGTGPERKHGLVETGSKFEVVINFDMF